MSYGLSLVIPNSFFLGNYGLYIVINYLQDFYLTLKQRLMHTSLLAVSCLESPLFTRLQVLYPHIVDNHLSH